VAADAASTEGDVPTPEPAQEYPARSRSKVSVVTGKLGVVQQSQLQNDYSVNGGEITPNGDIEVQANQPQQVAVPQVSNRSPSQQLRRVAPLSQIGQGSRDDLAQAAEQALLNNGNANNWSMFQSAAGDVREIIGDEPEGALSRFLDDGLHILLWYRHPTLEARIFWVELDLEEIRRDLASIIDLSARSDPGSQVCVALLDSDSHPVAMTLPGFQTDWKKPFVASEVGEILPHWEVAAYFLDPAEIASSARAARWLLWLLVPILLAAIGFGSVVIIRDVGREMHAARQKTDFVSNVSHELKTPLTSIRMFSDLLGKKQDVDPNKVQNYAGIISTEAARLTRLINNLLDFSRMERGEKKYDLIPFDAVALASEVVENYRLQIESEGIELSFADRIGTATMVKGDRDALAQVLLNLLSNAEKYGGDGGEIVVEARLAEDEKSVELRVMDRGPGVSRREAGRVFEKFYRVDDSLSTGIQGSGLGLTLARQIAQGHGGDVECCKRDDGERGGCFALRLPLAENPDPFQNNP
jgi:signal transduction histidine kinase